MIMSNQTKNQYLVENMIRSSIQKNKGEWIKRYNRMNDKNTSVPVSAVYNSLGLKQESRWIENTFTQIKLFWDEHKDEYPWLALDFTDYKGSTIDVWNITFGDNDTVDPITLIVGPGMNALAQDFGTMYLQDVLDGYFGREVTHFDYGRIESVFLY